MSADELSLLHTKMDTLLAAVTGNKEMGHKGLVQRMDEQEAKTEQIDRKLLKWTGVVIGVGGLATFLKDWAKGS